MRNHQWQKKRKMRNAGEEKYGDMNLRKQTASSRDRSRRWERSVAMVAANKKDASRRRKHLSLFSIKAQALASELVPLQNILSTMFLEENDTYESFLIRYERENPTTSRPRPELDGKEWRRWLDSLWRAHKIGAEEILRERRREVHAVSLSMSMGSRKPPRNHIASREGRSNAQLAKSPGHPFTLRRTGSWDVRGHSEPRHTNFVQTTFCRRSWEASKCGHGGSTVEMEPKKVNRKWMRGITSVDRGMARGNHQIPKARQSREDCRPLLSIHRRQ
ncbi:hypothetical protein B0H14DRAFT_2618560 [Mycena olivaceomarginata]|nr:hypothetical protein B0H14DRAFT_2618560 [Mycena olivaceomarginata]